MDRVLIETGNGGDYVLKGNDLAMVTGIENMPYIAMFGGGDNDWWANDLLYKNRPELQITSNTEQVLKQVVLNSNGRILIEQAVQKDLERIKKQYPDTDITIQVAITAPKRLEILIDMDGQSIRLLWNPVEETLTYQL